jgi:hypothetical protein
MNLFKRPIRAILSILITSITLWGCSMYHYQIHQVKTSNNTNDTLMNFSNSSIKISYDFWNDYGSYTCTIENLTDSLIYFNMEMSHLIYNSYANPYYSNKIVVRGLASSTTFVNPSSISNLSWGTSVTTTQDKIIILPPRSRKNIPSFDLTFLYRDCNLSTSKSFSMVTFNQTTTPLNFSNLLYYKVGEFNKYESIKNDFWISAISNISEGKFIRQGPETICGRQTGYITFYKPYRSNFKYYVKFKD